MAEWKASITRSRRSCAKLMGCVTSVTSCSNSIAFITPDRNFSDEPNIYFRPANIFGAGRAMLDLNRVAPEVTVINNARPRVALLYSQPSIFWEEKYKGTLFSSYTALNFMGEPITFVSERQLVAGTAAKVNWLIVPNATHIMDTTPAALAALDRSGGKILRSEE